MLKLRQVMKTKEANPWTMSNLKRDSPIGLYGFNGVLAAVSASVVCGGKLGLAILGAILATILTPAIAALGFQTLSAPFVFTTWLLVIVGWIEDRWFDPTAKPAAAS